MLANAQEIGSKVSRRFLQTPHLFYDNTIHYAEVCTWYAALRFASLTQDADLAEKLINRFEPLFGSEKSFLPGKNHVDFNMFGCLPLKIYEITGQERYKTLGLAYADSQWELPENPSEEQTRLFQKGYSWQTRLWMDDMYMITIVQAQAYAVTKDRKYIDRAAQEMTLYLDALQRPDGLFYHAPDAPLYWGRANGWMAAGMAELLSSLPADNPHFSRILSGYQRMMRGLKTHQSPDGMWKQILDDPSFWNETSCTGMFIYAMLAGIHQNLLSASEYADCVERAWDALVSYIGGNGDVNEVCAGTGTGSSKEHYYNRPRISGDYHGQAPALWCVNESLTEIEIP